MIPIPLSDWKQPNNSDFEGPLLSSFNVDLSENVGKLRIGKRIFLNTSTNDQVDITSYPVGFKFFSDNSGNSLVWTVMGSYVWNSNVSSNPDISQAYTKDAHTGTPTDCSTVSDIEVFNNELYVARDSNDISYLTSAAAAWATITGGSPGSFKQSLCVYGNRMYNGGSNTVRSWDSSHTLASSGTYSLTLDTGYVINFLRASSNRIWIGVSSTRGNRGGVFEWDGVATQPTKFYRLEATGALSCVVYNDIPFVMDTNANLLQWNGGAFIKISGLYRRRNKLLTNTLAGNASPFIHRNGMTIINNTISLLINGSNYDSTTSMEETIYSGVWEYIEGKGLIHKMSIGTSKTGNSITDYGAGRLSSVGGLAEMNLPSVNALRNGSMLIGVTYLTDATTTKSGVFYDDLNDTAQKAGSFVTNKISATDSKGFPTVQDTWQKLYTLYRKLLNANDKIVVKYRIAEDSPLELTGTWASTTTFTTTTDPTAYWTSGTGGEVEVLNGVGAGKCSHITNIVNNAGTYTITVDETYTSASGTFKCRLQLWKKLPTITYLNTTVGGSTTDEPTIGEVSNWIQFKFWCLFTGKDEIERLLLVTNNFNPAN